MRLSVFIGEIAPAMLKEEEAVKPRLMVDAMRLTILIPMPFAELLYLYAAAVADGLIEFLAFTLDDLKFESHRAMIPQKKTPARKPGWYEGTAYESY